MEKSACLESSLVKETKESVSDSHILNAIKATQV